MTTTTPTLDILRLAVDLMASTGDHLGCVSLAAVRLGFSQVGPEQALAYAAVGSYELDDDSGRTMFDRKLDAILAAIHELETSA